MSEPPRERARPTPMTSATRLALTAAAAALLLAGCGSAHDAGSSHSQDSAAATTVGGCPTDSSSVTGARTLASVDLDGDGKADTVKLTADSGGCADVLFAKVGDAYLATHLGGDGLPVTSAYAVALPGRDAQLLVTRQDHPRGGFQLRVFAASGHDLAELKAAGQSLVPFVATDVQEHPWTIVCTDGGVEVTEAVPHEPMGVVAAWDIKQTTYAVQGSTAQAGTTREIADNVLPHQLGVKYPSLVHHSAFAGCRA